MFTHAVLFQVSSTQLPLYRRDCRVWARYARRVKGFIAYSTLKRVDYKDQYASVYVWEKKIYHDRFMKEFHDWLVAKSHAKVKVLGYYNLSSIDGAR